jgi:hypothetical protein
VTAKNLYTGAQIVAAVWIIGLAVPVKAVVVGIEEVRDRIAGGDK